MFLIKAVIFTSVLLLYLHLQYQFKTSNELDFLKINDFNFPTREKLEEFCNYRQPMVFYNFQASPDLLAAFQSSALVENYATNDVQMREVTTISSNGVFTQTTLNEANSLWGQNDITDNDKMYISERNASFLQETNLKRMMVSHDGLMRPAMVVQCIYDVIMGSLKGRTPIRYEINYRNYFLVTEGSVKIKLTTPNSGRYLHEVKDYENLEFRSEGNDDGDDKKIKWLEINLNSGELIYLPPYWWYSLEINSKRACVCSFSYRTAMNILAIMPQLSRHFLQLRNITTHNHTDIKNETL